MKKLGLGLLVLFTLTGCGTMIKVPLDSTALSYDNATVIIYHQQGYSDKFPIYVDGQKQGIVTSEEPLKFEVYPGEHEIHSKKALIVDRILKKHFDAGKTYFLELRAEIGMWASSIWIEPTSPRDSYVVKSYKKVTEEQKVKS